MFEAKLVVQSLRINTLSKLTFSDSARFDGLLRDVFPGVEFKDIEYETLAEAIRVVCKESNLCLLYTSPSPRDSLRSRMPSSA